MPESIRLFLRGSDAVETDDDEHVDGIFNFDFDSVWILTFGEIIRYRFLSQLTIKKLHSSVWIQIKEN